MSLTFWQAVKTRQWNDAIYIIRYSERTWRKPFTCPCCDGKPGDWWGYGYEPPDYCRYCDGDGYVSVWLRWLWVWDLHIASRFPWNR